MPGLLQGLGTIYGFDDGEAFSVLGGASLSCFAGLLNQVRRKVLPSLTFVPAGSLIRAP